MEYNDFIPREGERVMIEIQNLTKVYKLSKKQMAKQKTKKNSKIAVQNLSLRAENGEIYGLLGPNGAGKTTTLRCIATLLQPTEGNISVCGHDTVKDSEAVRKSIGFLTTDIKLDRSFRQSICFTFLADCMVCVMRKSRSGSRSCFLILKSRSLKIKK